MSDVNWFAVSQKLVQGPQVEYDCLKKNLLQATDKDAVMGRMHQLIRDAKAMFHCTLRK
jgi:hypothetical protein